MNKCTVEITQGWDGKTLKSETFYDEPINTSLRSDKEVFMGFGKRSGDWIFENKIGNVDGLGYWRIAQAPYENGTKFIVDYGSWSYFGRVIIDEPKKSKHRRTTMSKKKPFSEVNNAKTIRNIERKATQILKDCAKKNAPEWYTRLVEEWRVNLTNSIKLYDFLYVTDVEGGDTRFTDKALALNVCDRKLLVKQEKAMCKFVAVLDERVDHGFPIDAPESCKTKCSKCTCKKDEPKAEEVKAEEVKTEKKVAKKATKKATKKAK